MCFWDFCYAHPNCLEGWWDHSNILKASWHSVLLMMAPPCTWCLFISLPLFGFLNGYRADWFLSFWPVRKILYWFFSSWSCVFALRCLFKTDCRMKVKAAVMLNVLGEADGQVGVCLVSLPHSVYSSVHIHVYQKHRTALRGCDLVFHRLPLLFILLFLCCSYLRTCMKSHETIRLSWRISAGAVCLLLHVYTNAHSFTWLCVLRFKSCAY